MKKIVWIFLIIITVVLLAACGKSTATEDNKQESAPAKEASVKESSSADNAKKARIYFDRNDESAASYKEHVTALWEQTKSILREDINKDYSDEEYKKLGAEIDAAWVNLQIHSSLQHQGEIDNIKDAKYGNIMENIMMLIDELYGNRDSGSKEARDKKRDNLKKSKLEYKIKEFDETLKNAE